MYTGTSLTPGAGSRVQGWMNSKSLILNSCAVTGFARSKIASSFAVLIRRDIMLHSRSEDRGARPHDASEGQRHAVADWPAGLPLDANRLVYDREADRDIARP